MALDAAERERYARNLAIPDIGVAGQEKLSRSRVLVVGAGGLGSPALFYLAAAGVGTLGIADGDRVDLSNLQRQILHSSEDLHRPKTLSARETLERLNPHVRIVEHPFRFTRENGRELVQGYDFVVEATDNFESKFCINDICVQEGVPYCHGGILGWFGQVMTVVPGAGPCYRCVFGEAPQPGRVPSTAQAGVLGVVPGVLGALQAAEAVKYLVGTGDLLTGRLLTFDALTSKFREVPLPPGPCGVCAGTADSRS